MSTSTLEHHVARFLGIKYNRSTRRWYEKNLQPLVSFLGGDRAVDSVDRTDAEAYWQNLQSKKACWDSHPSRPTERRSLSPTTLNNHLRAARTFWTEMVRQRVVEYNPFDHLRAPKESRPVEMKAIAPRDLRAIWDESKRSGARDYAIITILATCGLRAGELISMDTQRLDLNQGIAWVSGKRGWRKIFLGSAGIDAIDEYLRSRPINAASALWLNVHGQPLTTDGVRQMVDRLARRAGVRGRCNLHSFRHRTAQSWLDNGINAEIVAQALGHADVNVTLSIYGNQDERRVQAAMREVELAPFAESGPSS